MKQFDDVPRGTSALGIVGLCTKCGLNPKTRTHLWCTECRRDYGKRQRVEQLTRAERRGFLLGARVMRDEVVALFMRLSDSGMNGVSAAQLVQARLQPDQLGVRRVE